MTVPAPMPKSRAELHARRLEGFRRGFEGTTGNARAANLLMAVAYCCSGDGALPKWASDALNEAARSWLFHKVATLDEAFGVTKPKHFRAKRNQSAAFSALYEVLEDRRSKGQHAHDWRAIAERAGYGHTMLEELYRRSVLRELYPGKIKKGGMTSK